MTKKEKDKFRIANKQVDEIIKNVARDVIIPVAVDLMLNQVKGVALRLEIGEKIVINRVEDGLDIGIETKSKDGVNDILKRDPVCKEGTIFDMTMIPILGQFLGNILLEEGVKKISSLDIVSVQGKNGKWNRKKLDTKIAKIIKKQKRKNGGK